MSRCGLFCGPLGHDVFCPERVEARAMGEAKMPWEEEWREHVWPATTGEDDDGNPWTRPETFSIACGENILGRLSGDEGAPDRTQGDARTRLALAAPDLYRALASLLESPVLVESWDDVQQARAALKKARGE